MTGTNEPTRFPRPPVTDEEMTPELAHLDRLMIRTMRVKAALEIGHTNTAQTILAGAPCPGEFDVAYRVYLRNALENGAVGSETERLEEGMDRAFTHLAAGGPYWEALECLKRERTPRIDILRRPPLQDPPFETENSAPSAPAMRP